jgi:hypothetical protein
MESLAWDYASQPVVRERDVHMWRQLATWHVKLANRLRRSYTIHESVLDSPYASADDMVPDLRRGRFVVSRVNCAHPVWSPRENMAFRIVHDVLGHCAPVFHGWPRVNPYPFTWEGELPAVREHARHIPRDLWPALLTEGLGQVAWALTLGMFDVQKVATLDADPGAWLS